MAYARRTYGTAAARWAGLGPYYAMFPVAFADRVIRHYSAPGDLVLDPFAGRGTSIFSAAVQERIGVGVELNPVGWVYSRTKLSPAPLEDVMNRLRALEVASRAFHSQATSLPEFFHYCFSPRVRRFLLAARVALDWRRSQVDRTTMAMLLVHMHGKRADSLSNQMRQAKAMSPQYAIRWWRKRRLKPPDVDPVPFLMKRLAWRYAKGLPESAGSQVYLQDSTAYLPRLRRKWIAGRRRRAALLFTSPPYYHVTNYFYDQWLRLWLLGGRPNARRVEGRHRGKFESRETYRALLETVFWNSAQMLGRDACVYVRTDRRRVTYETTRDVLRRTFPDKVLVRRRRAFAQPTQTRLFGDLSEKAGEVDFILVPA